jgi:uncharacterized damage-inducible protein DinB
METSSPKVLIELYKNNHDIIHKQLTEISQAESLMQLPFRGNCMNWVVGHILGVRGEALELMGLPGTLSAAEEKVYGYGSDPLTDPAKAGDLSSMVNRLDESLARIMDGLDSLPLAEFDRQVRIWRGPMPLMAALSFIQWHESYHTGQLELLRQLAGKNDKVI